ASPAARPYQNSVGILTSCQECHHCMAGATGDFQFVRSDRIAKGGFLLTDLASDASLGLQVSKKTEKIENRSATTALTSDFVRLYHGTDRESAESILQIGLSQERSLALGGGSFWATVDVSTAETFAGLNPAGGTPVILGFSLSIDVINLLLR